MSLYVSVSEFKQAPTSVDVSTLDQTNVGNSAAQDAALLLILRRASAWVDNIVRMKTLQAGSYTETKEVNVLRDGRITIHPNNQPIVSLTSVGYRLAPNIAYTPIPLEYVQALEKWFTIWNINSNTLSPALMLQNQMFRYYSPYEIAKLRDMPLTVQYTYVSGYFSSTLNGAVAANAQQLVLNDVTGLSVGSMFTLYDGPLQEDCYVASFDTVNPNLVNLESPLLFAHADKTPASAVPDAVKQATILLANYLIRERGSIAMVMGETQMQGVSDKFQLNQDVLDAKEMLRPYVKAVASQ